MNRESHNTEWKRIWKDDYLKWICGFANAKGGTLVIGKDDDGEIIGLKNYQKLLEDLPNKMSNILGITADVNLLTENNKYFIEIKVDTYSTPISYKGHFYYRSGSTLQDLKGPALEKLILKKMGKKWDAVETHGFSYNDLSAEAFEIFRKKARRSNRVPEEDLNDTDEKLLQSLGLLTDKKLKRAAIIAFGKDPEKLITGAYVKIGFFRTHTDLLYQDEIHGSLFTQVEKTMDLLLSKYMKAHITYEGLTRIETYNFPEKAMREAILNALIHKDYSSANPIQISVYEDWLMIYNNGDLPRGWTTETLKIKHTSEPANPDIAKTFFRAGYIEIWGRGTVNIVDYCTQVGLPEPTFESKWGGLAVIFTKEAEVRPWESSNNVREKDTAKDTAKDTVKFLSKNEQKIFELINKNPRITANELSEIISINIRNTKKNMEKLKDKGLLKRIGSDKTGYWEIIVKDK